MLSTRRELEEFLGDFDPRPIGGDGLRRAAVACVLAPRRDGELSFLLTRRASTLRRHRGQFALPGGRIDPGESADLAARRELHEELAVDLAPSAVLGRLDDYATRSGYVITPVVLWCDARPEVRPAPEEVARVFRVSFAELDHEQMPTLRAIEESDRPVLSVPLRGNFVHAPTAAVIYQLWEMVWRGRRVHVADYEQPVFAWR